MGRWLSYDGSVGPVGEHSHPMDCDAAHADEIALLHNADCDAYEARIAELEAEAKANIEWQESMVLDITALRAELARVKAESLRVVEDPDSEDWCMTPTGLGWYGTDSIGNSSIETPTSYHDIAQCRKVRLEHWEKET